MIFKNILPFLFLILALVSSEAGASSTRTIDGDTIKSSDHTKTWTLPASSGTLGLGGGTLTQETPSGTINGSNQTFTLAHTPLANSLNLYVDGLPQILTTHYTIVSGTITMVTAPAYGQTIYASYSY
jgi:hypothetical protein